MVIFFNNFFVIENNSYFKNQTQTGTALQAFYNLELLCEAVGKIKEESIEKLKECVEVALSSKNIQASLNNSTTYGKGKQMVFIIFVLFANKIV